MDWQRVRWVAVALVLVAGCTSATPPDDGPSSSTTALDVSTSPQAPATTASTTPPSTSAATTSTSTPPVNAEEQRVLLTGNVEFESSEYVEWGGSTPGCSLTGQWGDFLLEGATVQVHDRNANLLGEGVLAKGETKAHIHCHFAFAVEVPANADWYSVCVVGFGPAGPLPREDLIRGGWKTSVAAGGEPPQEATSCDTYLGDRFGPLDDEGWPPPVDAEVEWAQMRSLWEQILSDGYLNGYTIEYSRSSPTNSTSDENGDYRFDVADGLVTYCRFTSSSNESAFDSCAQLEGTSFSPVDSFYALIEGFGREQVVVEFDLELPMPTLIRHDRAGTTGEEYTIRVTRFQGEW